jgi:hypothetical protein
MSFMLTTEQVRTRTKRVTRRLGHKDIKVGELRQPIVKGQGLKKGEKVQKINGPIRFTAVSYEPLEAITPEDVIKEGFPGMTPFEFITMFRQHAHCLANDEVTRIEFEYVEHE